MNSPINTPQVRRRSDRVVGTTEHRLRHAHVLLVHGIGPPCSAVRHGSHLPQAEFKVVVRVGGVVEEEGGARTVVEEGART